MRELDHQTAAALDGDDEALAALAREDPTGAIARRHRIGAALYLRASRRNLRGPAVEAWHRDLFSASTQYLRLSDALERVATVLAAAGIDWIPLKGYDLATRVYADPEERPTADLDLLIAAADFVPARRRLESAGWRGLAGGKFAERYLAEEGYAWQATDATGILLELHFRLWGCVAEDLAAVLIDGSTPDPSLPPAGRRLALPHAFLVAAVHAWLGPRDRGAGVWWDLVRICEASSPALVDEVIRTARHGDLQLLVGLAAEVASELWRHDGCRRIAEALARELRGPERLEAALVRRRGLSGCSFATLQAARLASRRRSRSRWRAPWRRIWAHPGAVESATPEDWPWPARRLWYLLVALRLTPLAGWIEKALGKRARDEKSPG
ncbi:MAG: nucleotidyltransferase family protein [bacterium]|nr:nucleotidyltransferase family protein [bacterium]